MQGLPLWLPPTDEVPFAWAPTGPIVLKNGTAAVFIVSAQIYSAGVALSIHARLRTISIAVQHQQHVFAKLGEIPGCQDESIDLAAFYSNSQETASLPSFRLLGATASGQAFDAQIWIFPRLHKEALYLTIGWPSMHLQSATFEIVPAIGTKLMAPQKLWTSDDY